MPVIEWGNWQAAQEAITNGNNALSSMKPPAAETALKFTKVTLNDGTTRYVANTVTPPQNNPQLNYDTGSLEAYYEYVGKGGQTTSTGAAATAANTSQVNNMAMTQKAGGLAGVGALLSVNLPTAAAAIAPVAGVAIGAGLYSLNPDLWDKISRALLPFCYEGTELLPVVADENGVTYFPEEAVDAVSNVIKENSKIEGTSEYVNLAEYIAPYPFSVMQGTIAYCSPYAQYKYSVVETDRPINFIAYTDSIDGDGRTSYMFASSEPFQFRTYNSDELGSPPSWTKWVDANLHVENGKNVYSGGLTSGSRGSTWYPSANINVIKSLYPAGAPSVYSQLEYAVAYGVESVPPAGTTQWTGVQYPLNPEGISVVTRISPDGQLVTTSPYYPITMPVGDPGASPSPNEVPVPGVNPEVAPAVNPWLTPKPNKKNYPEGQPESEPAKIPNPVPDTDPNLDPNANPSQSPEPQPQPDPDPVQSTRPNDGGTTPLPAIPIIPTLPSAATGLLHVYNPTQSQIDAFGSWLWTTFSGDLIDTISKLFNDPMDAIIGLHELYATPAVSGSSTIRAGFLDSGVSSNIVGSRYTTINCGSIVVQEYYQNYLDYSPYTKCYIYLPFVGIVPVLADDIIGNAVNVTYHVDSYTGCCIAVVTVAREGYSSTVYQFEGNCAVEIPITSGYQSTLMGALIGIGATALTGNPHAGIATASMGRASLGKNDVSHSGSFGSSYGAMGAKVPYIIVKRPTQKSVVNYNQDYGFPAHKRVTIGACSGYLRAREVHVISPTATDEEKAKIEELLKGGVFVK